MKIEKFKNKVAFSLLPLTLAVSNAMAQESVPAETASAPQVQSSIEEMVVLGRLKSAAGDVTVERMEHETVSDIVDIETIARIGDPNVASALRRVPGVTLVDGKFVYVRGLGERYSSTTLNGAQVPSPDLTRNVLPLDIFPTTILRSVEVQKGYSPDMPAAFGGGNIDIRTKGVPDGPMLKLEIGTGLNSNSDMDGLTYQGGDDAWGKDDGTRALSKEFVSAIDRYQGNVSSNDILDLDEKLGGDMTIAEANAINADIATGLNRDLDIQTQSMSPDIEGKIGFGNSYLLDSGVELGYLVGGSYGSKYRNYETTERSANPLKAEVEFSEELKTVRTVDLTGNIAVGAKLDDENQVDASYIFIRNTDDEAAQAIIFDADRSGDSGFRSTDTEQERRELKIAQLKGQNRLGTLLRNDDLPLVSDITFDWYVSDSEAITDIPGAYSLIENSNHDEETGELLSASLGVSERMVEYKFVDLLDQVDSSGISAKAPLELDSMEIIFSGGYEYTKKARSYKQTDISLGSQGVSGFALNPILGGSYSEVFSDGNIVNPDYGFTVFLDDNNVRSYLAGITNAAGFGQADFYWYDTFRIVLGARWEEYNQVSLPWQPYNYGDDSQITTDEDEILELTFKSDEWYPSVSATYMKQDFLGADDWQLRFSMSETVVRPDLREVSDSSYRDPLTDFIVSGNPDVVPSDVSNFDLRAEWFYGTGDNLTLSFFYKDILNPIEYREEPGSDKKRTAKIYNEESAEVYGLEIEWLTALGKVADVLDPFFVAGNVTLADSELVSPDPRVTSQVRPLQGASEYVVNFQLGFDSPDSKHAATLIYNVFGERLFAAGFNGTLDSYEQPFNSLDLTYSWYPVDAATVTLKAKNLLGEDKVITSVDDEAGTSVDTFTRTVGTAFSIDVQWSFY